MTSSCDRLFLKVKMLKEHPKHIRRIKPGKEKYINRKLSPVFPCFVLKEAIKGKKAIGRKFS